MSRNEEPPPPLEGGGGEKPLLITLIENNIFRYGYSLRYVRPRGFNNAEVWSPDRIDVEPGFSVNPYTTFNNDIDRFEVRTPDPLVKLGSRLAGSYVKVGGYDKFPFNTGLGWSIALRYWRRAIPWPRPSNYVREEGPYRLERLEPDVLVIGGGISGLHAALSAAQLKLKTVLLEMDYWIGGRYPLVNKDDMDGTSLTNLAKTVEKLGAKILLNTVFQGFHSDYPYAIDWRRRVLFILNPKVYIFATGHYEVPPLLEGIDIPKCIPFYTYMKLVKRFGVKHFRKVIVYGGDSRVESLKTLFEKEKVDAIFLGSEVDGFTSYPNIEYLRISGEDAFEYVELEYNGGREKIKGDIFIYLGDRVANSWLTLQIGITHLFIDGLGGYIPWHDIEGSTEKENIFIAGSLGGVYNFNYDVLTGLVAGLKAGEYLGIDIDEEKSKFVSQIREMLDKDERADKLFGSIFRRENVYPNKEFKLYRDKSKVILCSCTDVSLEDIDHSVERLGTHDIELLKRYSGVLTGRCQGKLCLYNLHRYLHNNHGRMIRNIHHRIRPPYIPHQIHSLEVEKDEV